MIGTAASPVQSPGPEHFYWQKLDERILSAVREPGADLASVCEVAGGAFPSVVAERLALYGISLPAGGGEVEEVLPGAELHAAEFEWYFTTECARELAGLLAVRRGSTLLFGGPSVASALMRAGSRPISVDRSPFLCERFEGRLGDLRQADLRQPLGMLRSAATVFFDAPWHEDHIARWLWQASLAVRRGGCVAFALFGPTTRAAARAERARLLAAAEAIGGVTLHEEALHYRTPLFEAEALRAAGHPVLSSWRRGDLVLIENVKRALPPPAVPRERQWVTRRRGNRVLKLGPGGAHAKLEREKLKTLETVSRRRIAQVPLAVWDSRNGTITAEPKKEKLAKAVSPAS